MLCFGASVNCIPWVYVPEILPLHARAKGMAVGISSNWLWNFVIVMVTPVIISTLRWKAYLIFTCTNLAFVPLVYFCYPETANFTLEEIDSLFTVEGKKATAVAKQRKKEGRVGIEGHGGVGVEDGRAALQAGLGEKGRNPRHWEHV